MAGSKKTSGTKKTGSGKSTGATKATASKKSAGAKRAGKASGKARVAAAPVSFATQIAPLFRTIDVQCMRSRGVFLKSYDYMKDPDNANLVLTMLQPDADPRMPFGGPYWTDENIDLFQQWITDGLQP